MRKEVKKQLLEVFKTIYEAHGIIKGYIDKKEYGSVNNLLADCQDTAMELAGVIEASEGEGFVTISYLEEYCKTLYEVATTLSSDSNGYKVQKLLDKKIIRVENSVRNDVVAKVRIVFFPYKASMWTSFESIWECASKDERCEVKVVPIPYCEYDENMQVQKWNYEIDMYPEYVPVTRYNQYNLEQEKPDIAFIHNAYDNNNTLTSVHPAYYSSVIKQHTGCLVYSPYFTLGGYTKGSTDSFFLSDGSLAADKVIVQSKFTANLYQQYGYDAHRLVVHGSPKIDSVITKCGTEAGFDRENALPEEWKEKLAGKKKIFLFNTHWAYFLKGDLYRQQGNFDFAQKYHMEFFNAIARHKDTCGMIWRPHPLLIPALRQRAPHLLEFVENFTEKIQNSDFAVMDTNGSYVDAFRCSDALVTTYSSLINEYIATGKPVQIFQSKQTEAGGKRSPLDYRTCYFSFKKDDGISFTQFIRMVLRGEDPMYEERMEMLRRKTFDNMDGSAGRKILDELINL